MTGQHLDDLSTTALIKHIRTLADDERHALDDLRSAAPAHWYGDVLDARVSLLDHLGELIDDLAAQSTERATEVQS